MVSQLSESTALFSTDVSTDCLAQRLDDYRAVIASPPVDIVDPTTLNHQELAKLRERVAVANFAHYRCAQAVNDTAVLALCHQVGLKNLHQSVVTAGLTKIEVSPGSKARYIPYTNSELNWHTDGYYYPETYPVRAMLLHCVRPALEGGATELINHEIVYALLAQTNPDYVAALSQADVMTIPANSQAPDGPRQAQSGPVFWQDPGRIYMRYTTRRHNIQWRQDPLSHEAVEALAEILRQRTDLVFHRQLGPSEGVLSNNTPHRREPFQDSTERGRGRLFYRGRFHDNIRIP
ncbi:hypothetical protein MGWOODY_XGa1474 [hydrothermal vent metagenome]|jgi:hypothetical protein|uniref:TauD/TfdA-like domain-containing protein n=1 Tax=hydrothermal vent metagenome TaxID=652676 RepID=A0A160TWS5_9ZZZZ|nr:TauD/TfdA family dioxygenase [Gammaproteobacteria bacterium]PDH43247.1 MAG: taurine catabolism dioxygenase TauD [Candidatus Thioglobus sp. MED-G25]|tara:strand:+ start:959 stop:1834 length:876 start_codon:yes stop_codon:yes gene_type:complete